MNLQRRDFAIREIGCLACLLSDRRSMPVARHHLLTTGRHGTGKRRGERESIGLCDYHHQGAKQVGTAFARNCVAEGYGPSLADEPRAFRQRFGTDDELLTLQNQLLARWEAGNV
jgi:hypothetical protein